MRNIDECLEKKNVQVILGLGCTRSRMRWYSGAATPEHSPRTKQDQEGSICITFKEREKRRIRERGQTSRQLKIHW